MISVALLFLPGLGLALPECKSGGVSTYRRTLADLTDIITYLTLI